MNFTTEQLELINKNSVNVSNAMRLARFIEDDFTVGGIFPNADSDDLSTVDERKFSQKWCKWWTVAEVLLKLAKAFTGDKGDKVIDAILELGNKVCKV